MTPRRGAAALVALGAVLISFSAVFVKLAHVGPTAVAFYRMFFGGVGLAAVVAVRRERVWRGWLPFALAAACGLLFAFDLTLWHRSIRYVGPGLATVLASCQVFFVGAFGVLLLRERLGWRLAVAVPAAVVGLYLVVGVNWSSLPPAYRWGVALGLASALTYTAFILVLMKSQRLAVPLTPVANVAVLSLVASVALAAAARGTGESLAIPDAQSWLALVGYGVAGQVLGWVLISRGMPSVPVSRVGLLLLLQPALAFVWDMVFFGRPTTAVDLVGVAVTLGAIYLGASAGFGKKTPVVPDAN